MEIEMPEGLLERIQALCEKRDMDPEEFIRDAIREKLERAHRERRKKPRL
ncbi:MAG: ribbon-helix-helix protein, CopG family [Desulfobacterales bacterium]|jgi:metal-responsive CopG/Arc/MetJ family transcriptional regulator